MPVTRLPTKMGTRKTDAPCVPSDHQREQQSCRRSSGRERRPGSGTAGRECQRLKQTRPGALAQGNGCCAG
eukprot:366454-Chlamydomonas_euryale.AAC.9